MELVNLLTSLLVLIVLEIILGIDNLIFLSILTEKLPTTQRANAQKVGLSLALMTRLLLLGFAVKLSTLTTPYIVWHTISFSIRDLFLFIGGAFLIAKATQEIHHDIEQPDKLVTHYRKTVSFKKVVIQIAVMDIIFSFDSVLTAIGLTTTFWVMALAISVAILIMIYASRMVSQFIEKNPTIKMLALSFLILIGMVLIADSFSFYIPRAYVYFAMGFSLAVELLNLLKRRIVLGKY
jgi:predicted tellurium resistance membrane protein TerC